MKIEGYRTDISNPGLDHVGRPTEATGTGSSSRPGQTAPAAGDEVRLSDDAQLMQKALQVAQQTPAIRQDVVDRMRALLDKGEIGNDPGRIADSIIDKWLTTP